MKAMPLVQKFMTAMPHTIGNDISIKKAKEMMTEFRVRHLPVMHGGELVGVLTERDIFVASSFIGSAEMKVEDVMMPMTYSVTPETPLDRVVAEMAERKLGSTIVRQENGKVVGIFTSTDACAVLAEILHQNYKGA